jgi:predicted NBD/HSP70 family sugar kinase
MLWRVQYSQSRPFPVLFVYRRDENMYLGIDIGGTTARVSAFGDLSEAAEIQRIEFAMTKQPQGDFEADFANLRLACGKLAARHGAIDGIGLALAGKVDDTRATLTAAGNIGHWAGHPVVLRLSQEMDCRVVLGNDAEAAALAEAHYGHGQTGDFWLLIWGTGVGGCLMRYVNGVATPFPGELGHQEVNPNSDLLCGCSQYGCLEACCGGTGIANRFGIPAEALTAEQWADVLGWMKIGVRNVVTAQPVPRVVFSGGIASKQAPLLEDLQEMLAKDLRIVDPPEIQLSAFGETAGTVGALALLRLQ